MKRGLVILAALTIILTLSYALSMAQEAGERPREAGRREIEEKREAEQLEKEAALDRLIEQRKRMREAPERLYEKLFAELERQRNEIRALREEIGALRRMLEDQYALRRLRRDRRRQIRPRRWEPRRESEHMPLRDRWEPERREIRRDPDIDMEIRELREALERRPDDIEPRMRLADLYREVGKIEAAIEQYKAALEIAPGFDPPYRALRELGYKFPDMPRDREEPLKDSAGEVISTSEAEITLRILEGDVVTFKVPSRRKEDGSWVLNEDFSEFAKSLEPGTRVKILWREAEGQKFIRRIERTKE